MQLIHLESASWSNWLFGCVEPVLIYDSAKACSTKSSICLSKMLSNIHVSQLYSKSESISNLNMWMHLNSSWHDPLPFFTYLPRHVKVSKISMSLWYSWTVCTVAFSKSKTMYLGLDRGDLKFQQLHLLVQCFENQEPTSELPRTQQQGLLHQWQTQEQWPQYY